MNRASSTGEVQADATFYKTAILETREKILQEKMR